MPEEPDYKRPKMAIDIDAQFLDIDPLFTAGNGREGQGQEFSSACACVVSNAKLSDDDTDTLVSTAVVVSADVIVSETHLTAAVSTAALATARGVPVARSFHAEVLYRLSPCRRVGDALKKLGMKKCGLLDPIVVVGFGASDEDALGKMEKAVGLLRGGGGDDGTIEGSRLKVVPLRGANSCVDAASVKKLYELTDAELDLPGEDPLLSAVLTKMAVKECMR